MMRITEKKIREIVKEEVKKSLNSNNLLEYDWAGADFDMDPDSVNSGEATKIMIKLAKFFAIEALQLNPKYYITTDEFKEKYEEMIKKSAPWGTVLGTPAASDFYENIPEGLSDYTGLYPVSIAHSKQLQTKDEFDAINKFYKPSEVITLSSLETAEDFNGNTHPSAEKSLYWGSDNTSLLDPTATVSAGPQYFWLARELGSYGVNTLEKVEEILTRWKPKEAYGDVISSNVMSGFESPYWNKPKAGKAEAAIVWEYMQKLAGNYALASWPVFYCRKKFKTYREFVDQAAELAPNAIISFLFGIMDLGANEDYQNCYFGHLTSDPRFVDDDEDYKGKMVFRIP